MVGKPGTHDTNSNTRAMALLADLEDDLGPRASFEPRAQYQSVPDHAYGRKNALLPCRACCPRVSPIYVSLAYTATSPRARQCTACTTSESEENGSSDRTTRGYLRHKHGCKPLRVPQGHFSFLTDKHTGRNQWADPAKRSCHYVDLNSTSKRQQYHWSRDR